MSGAYGIGIRVDALMFFRTSSPQHPVAPSHTRLAPPVSSQVDVRRSPLCQSCGSCAVCGGRRFFRMQKCSFYDGIYVNGAVPESVANYNWDSAPWAQQLSTIFFVVFLLSSLLPVSQPTPVFGPKGGTIC